jgi:hypothetical protein
MLSAHLRYVHGGVGGMVVGRSVKAIRLLAVVGCVAAASLLTPESRAAPIRECGDYSPTGGAGVYNVTTRVTSCRTARRMARRFWNGKWGNFRSDGWSFRRGSYTCRNRQLGVEFADLRCTASRGRVVHWQWGA